MKELDLKKSVAELVREYPELKEILAEIGFQDIMKPAALKLMGSIMTLPRGAVVKGIPMEKIRAALEAKGFVLKGAEQQARQAARAVLPNATETRIVVTGNYRAWRHFIAMRASEHADVEIRRLAVECLRQLTDVAPAAFGDFQISALADGTEVATSPLATEV